MGKRNTAKSGGASAIMKKQMEKKAAKSAPRPVESDEESEESENYMTFNKKSKDSDDEEEDEEVFNMALDKDDDDEESNGSESESEGDDSEEEDGEEEEGSDEQSYDEDDSDDGEENETQRELKELVSNLPAHLRQQVLKKEAAAKRRRAGEEVPDSEEEDEEESEGEEEEGWGRKKKTYWEGDTADLEIGQEMEDALEEEEAAEELHREKTKRMKASDFMEDFEGSDDSSSDSDDTNSDDDENSIEKGYKTSNNEITVGNLASISLGQDEVESEDDENEKVQIEKLTKNIDHLTKKQRLDMISKNSPELLGIVNELKEQIGDLKGRILPVKEFITKISTKYTVQDDIVDYLEVKSQLLLSYCINVVYYLYNKAKGIAISNHPVMKQLLKLRYIMEKMRPLDGKLKHQIDRLIQLSELSPSDLSEQKSSDLLRPNPMALLSSSTNTSSSTNKKKKNYNNSSDEEDDEDSETGYSEQKENEETDGVYKVPKRVAVPYKIAETILDKKEAKIEKQKQKIKRSELMDTLREEFGNAPEAAASSGLGGMKSGDLKKLQEEEDERRDFEEERFVRLTMSRKDKQSNKRRTAEASRLDNFDDIGDIGDFEEITKLAGGAGGSSTSELMERSAAPMSKKASLATGSALQRAVMALAGSNNNEEDELVHGKDKKSSKMRAMAAAMAGDSDDEDPYAALLAAGPDGNSNTNDRKRRRAPMSHMNDSEDDQMMDRDYGNEDDNSDDGDNLLEDFSLKKKKYLEEKKSHYTAEPKYAGYEDNINGDSKRAASYEIIKNKGLTPHRKKANRNPRVKKREMFDKAVIRRKGQVRDVISGAAGAYGGELTGIKSNLARSRKIGV